MVDPIKLTRKFKEYTGKGFTVTGSDSIFVPKTQDAEPSFRNLFEGQNLTITGEKDGEYFLVTAIWRSGGFGY